MLALSHFYFICKHKAYILQQQWVWMLCLSQAANRLKLMQGYFRIVVPNTKTSFMVQ